MNFMKWWNRDNHMAIAASCSSSTSPTMDKTLPTDVLGQIFTYLPISNAARFERLSKRCALAIRENMHSFNRPNIHVKVTLGAKGVAFEVFEDCRASCLTPRYYRQRISRKFVPIKSEINTLSSYFLLIKNALGFKGEYLFSPIRSAIRDINKNMSTLYEKWGPRQKVTPRISTLRIVTKSPCPGLSETVAGAFAQENTIVDCIYIEFRTFAKCMPIEIYNRELIRNAVDLAECGVSSRLYMDASCLNVFTHFVIFTHFDYFQEVTIQCLVSYHDMLGTLGALRDERVEDRSKPWKVEIHCYVAKFPIQPPLTCLEQESIEDVFVITVQKTGETREYEFFTLKLDSPANQNFIDKMMIFSSCYFRCNCLCFEDDLVKKIK